MVKKFESKEAPSALAENLFAQITDLQENNERFTEIVNRLTEERRQLLGENPTESQESEQRAYELMAQLLDKITDQRNQAYLRINSVIKQLIK